MEMFSPVFPKGLVGIPVSDHGVVFAIRSDPKARAEAPAATVFWIKSRRL